MGHRIRGHGQWYQKLPRLKHQLSRDQFSVHVSLDLSAAALQPSVPAEPRLLGGQAEPPTLDFQAQGSPEAQQTRQFSSCSLSGMPPAWGLRWAGGWRGTLLL